MIFLHTIIFKTSQYLVAVFAFSLTCVVFNYLLLKVSSVNSVPSRSYRTAIARICVQVLSFLRTLFLLLFGLYQPKNSAVRSSNISTGVVVSDLLRATRVRS